MYYVAVSLCAAAMLFAVVGRQRLVAVIAPAGLLLIWAAGTQLRTVRPTADGWRDLVDYRSLGLIVIGVIWVIIGVAALG
jgi:hypothetical protein